MPQKFMKAHGRTLLNISKVAVPVVGGILIAPTLGVATGVSLAVTGGAVGVLFRRKKKR